MLFFVQVTKFQKVVRSPLGVCYNIVKVSVWSPPDGFSAIRWVVWFLLYGFSAIRWMVWFLLDGFSAI
jgi:hypothetical protein